jgi:UDP-glucuronate 4-epimerase
MIEAALGKKAEIILRPEHPGYVPRTFADVSKAHEILGYSPETPIAEGIAKYAAWSRNPA